MIAEWRRDAKLLAAIHTLPEALDRAVHCDWSELAAAIHGDSLYTLGRGPSWAIANAVTLKFKETCQIHAESYSSAAVLHGPVSIIASRFPALGFAAADKAEAPLVAVDDQIAETGAAVRDIRQGAPCAQPAGSANGALVDRSDRAHRQFLRHGRAGRPWAWHRP